MSTMGDILVDKVVGSFRASDSQTNALATATKAAVAGKNHVVTTIDASYSSSTVTGLLQVKFGTTVVAEKYIHGAGALDLDVVNPTANSAVSAELAAGGAGVLGKLVLCGYTTGPLL